MRKVVLAGLLAMVLAGTGCPPLRAQEKTDISFSGTELEKVLEWVSKMTQKRFLYDEKIKKRKIYVVSPVEVPRDKIFEIFQSILQANKFILVKKGSPGAEIYQVVELIDATKTPVPTLGETESVPLEDIMMTKVLPLRYADPRSVQTALQPLISDPKGIVVVEEVGAVIVTDYALNINRIEKVINLMDKEKPGILTEVVQLQYSSAADMEAKIQKLLPVLSQTTRRPGQGQPGQPGAEVAQVVADTRTNKLIIVAAETRLRQILSLVAEMDVKLPNEPKLVHVRQLKHANAKTMAENLNKIFTVVGQARQAAIAGATPTGQGAAPPTGSGLPGAPTLTPSIVPDEANNSLIIVADAGTYAELDETISALDVRRPQVLIEGAVVEVAGDNNLDLGVELSSVDGPGKKIRGFGSSSFGLSTLADTDGDAVPDVKLPFRVDAGSGALIEGAGLTFGLMRGPDSPNVGAVVSMLKTTRDVNVLQLPQVTTNDNVGALLRVTEAAPTVSFIQTQAGNNVQTFNNFQEAGITLQITPHISEAEYLRLEISQKIEQFEGVQTNPAVPPPKTTREIVNVVTIPNRRTAVIGGLVRDLTREEISRIPFIGDIPFLGEFFKRTIKTAQKSTLYLFITPKILKDENFADYMEETDRRSREMEERTLGKWRGVKQEVSGESRSLETIEYKSPFAKPVEEVDLPTETPVEQPATPGENR